MSITPARIVAYLLLPLLVFILACEPASNNETKQEPVQTPAEVLVPMIPYSLVKKLPHEISNFTEGLLFHNNLLYESTGSPGLPQTKSTIGIYEPASGAFQKKVEIDRNQFFGEGIVVVNNLLYQLTYTNQVGFKYDAKSFTEKGRFTYANREGWGMTYDGTNIVMSDGTNLLTYINPVDFTPVKTLPISENGFALDHLNELEFINGFIYANVWMTNFIVKIDPASGKVVGKLDLSDLYSDSRHANINLGETNGIAYDSIQNKILVTGKLWPYLYEISFAH